MREPTYEVTPDGTYVFEVEWEDGTRHVIRAEASLFPGEVKPALGRDHRQPVIPFKPRRIYCNICYF